MYLRPERTGRVATGVVRLVLFLVFFLLVGRLYQLQILQGGPLQVQADVNRLRTIEVPALRGVIYDAQGEILARNRPSFVIAVIPAELPNDDLDTEVDEQRIALGKLLEIMNVSEDEELALSMAEVMFRRLGRSDFTRTIQQAGIDVDFRLVTLQIIQENEEGEEEVVAQPAVLPDLSRPLPQDGLLALLERAVAIGSQGSSFAPIPILELVERERAFAVAEELYQISGVRVEPEPVREYPYRELVSHTLGFLGPIPRSAAESYAERGYNDPNEQVGLNGLEYTYQDPLRGVPGRRVIEVDILGRESRTVGEPIEPVPGLNLRLSLDIRLQQVMYEALGRMMEEHEAPHAAAVAMDPQTGAILGLVSLPSFDNNIFSEGLGEDYLALEEQDPVRRPLINYAIGGLYPPGSTFKVVTSTGALAEGIITPRTVIVDNGPLFLPNRYFPDDPTQAQEFVSWNHKLGINHGNMTVIEGLGLSNDIFFYWLGGGFPNAMEGLGNERMAKWMELFGYGSPTGIDLPGEVSAFVPDDQWKRLTYAESWVTGDSYNMSIGQGFVLGTPLEVLQSAAAVANGGKIMKPQIVQEMIDAEGGLQWRYEPTIIRELPVSAEHLSYVQRGLWSAVNAPWGTAPNGRVEGVEVAGKTGTAEFCEYDPAIEDCIGRDEEGNLPFHAWYFTYAPYENPEIALVVFLYNGGEGSTVAVPVAQEILAAYFGELRK